MNPKLLNHFIADGIVAGLEHKAVLYEDLKTIIDIGANKGQFALAGRFFTKAHITSFEPLESPAKKFIKIFKDYDDVVLKKIAIGPKNQDSKIFITNNDDSSSLLEIGDLQGNIYDTRVVGTENISIKPLHEVVDEASIISPSLLKIDVQGYEEQVIDGCRKIINSFDYIYCECSYVELYKGQALAYEVINQLNDLGFQVAGVYNTYYEHGQSIQSDILFKKVNTAVRRD
jgi:FkbM family methyltransferase